jgi:hypothetical protein
VDLISNARRSTEFHSGRKRKLRGPERLPPQRSQDARARIKSEIRLRASVEILAYGAGLAKKTRLDLIDCKKIPPRYPELDGTRLLT